MAEPIDPGEVLVAHFHGTYNEARAEGGWRLPLPDSGSFVLEGFAVGATFDPWPLEPVGHSGLVGYTLGPDVWGIQPRRSCQLIRTHEDDLAYDHGRRLYHDRGERGVKVRFWRGTVIHTGTGESANEMLRRFWPDLRTPPEPPLPYDYAAAWEREKAFRAEIGARFAWRPQ